MMILHLGNYLNQGTRRGNASGYRIDVLNKLADTRSRDGKMSLLRFAVEMFKRDVAPNFRFSSVLEHAKQACRVSKEELSAELLAFERAVAMLGREVTSMVKEAGIEVDTLEPVDPTVDVPHDIPPWDKARHYHAQATQSAARLRDSMDKMSSASNKLCKYLAEERTKLNEVFDMLLEFTTAWDTASAQSLTTLL